jgi:LmbE family N-acetylglucosaminyl deacetylase
MSRILFIGAHPDDVELGCGGTISKFSDLGYNISVLIIAEGTSGRFDEKDKDTKKVATHIQNRKQNCTNSLKILGVNNIKFCDLPCGNLNIVPLLKINKLIEDEIRSFKPEIIFTHSSVDTNKDHRIVFESTKIATRPSAFSFVKKVFSYEVLSSTECSFLEVFSPKHFIVLSKEHLERKNKALACYNTEIKEFPHPRSLKGVEVLAKFRGMQINKEYAESFEILRSIL